MAQKLMSVTVKGKHKTWGFTFFADEKYLPDWHADGLDIGLIENVIPAWVVNIGLLRPWYFFQDLWNLKNPFRK